MCVVDCEALSVSYWCYMRLMRNRRSVFVLYKYKYQLKKLFCHLLGGGLLDIVDSNSYLPSHFRFKTVRWEVLTSI